MQTQENWTLFAADSRYRLRERLFLGVFLLGVALLAWNWETIDGRLLSWRLRVGVNEWDALFRIADKGPSMIPFIEDQFDDPDPEVRYRALLALKAMRNKAAIPHLRSWMDDSDTDVRINAFDAMALVGAKEGIPVLIDALGSESFRIRRVAHRSLHMLTEKTFDYDPESSVDQRNRSISRWEAWWASRESEAAPPAEPEDA